MNATVIATRPGTIARPVETHLVRDGVFAAAAAAALNAAVAAGARRADVSLELSGRGGSIPLSGFVQITFLAAMIGIGMAVVVRRRSDRPAAVFTVVAGLLTAASLVPPVVAGAGLATKGCSS